MLLRLLIIVIIAAVVFYLLRKGSPNIKANAKRVLPWVLSPAIFPLVKRMAFFLFRILFRR